MMPIREDKLIAGKFAFDARLSAPAYDSDEREDCEYTQLKLTKTSHPGRRLGTPGSLND